MPVESLHKEYSQSLKKWTLVRDCIQGDQEIHDKGELYLPHPNKDGDDSKKRYEAYSKRAIFTNVIKPTHDAMVGMTFRLDPKSEIPTTVDYLNDNATGSGLTLNQLAKTVVSELVSVGRYGLLVDHPASNEGLSDAQVRALGLQATIKCYPAESIINWQESVVNGETVVSLVVLKETYTKSADKFTGETLPQYRVLSLEGGVYTVEIWRDDELFDSFTPRDSGGSNLTAIPFIAAGAYVNDIDVDSAILYDMAVINIGHYRNSADKEEALFLHGQPMIHIDIGDTNPNQWQELNPRGVEVGARRGIITSGGGSATLLQAQANDPVSMEMLEKRKEMVEIGARLIQDGGQAETATAAVIRYASTNSVLTNIVQNASSAIEEAVKWCGLFMGSNEDVSYEINSEFYQKGLDATQVMASIQLFDRGAIAKQDLRDGARKTGLLSMDRTDEQIDQDASDQSPIE